MGAFLADQWVTLVGEALGVAWLWLPAVLIVVLYKTLYSWLKLRWRFRQEFSMIEIKLPKELTRSPKAMEMVLTALHLTTAGLTYNQWFEGSDRVWSSLEIASFGGDIRFYIRVVAKWKNMLTAQIYAHYPSVEIITTDDYTAKIPYNLPGSDWDLWGGIYDLARNSGGDEGYPITTYVDLGLDKDPKEEFKVDPLVPILEHFGQIGPNEQIWLQIVLRAVKASEWQAPVRKLVDKLAHREEDTGDKINFAKQTPTPGERDVITAIERKLSKLTFQTGIRVLYMTRRGHFKVPNVLPFLGMFKSVASDGLNSIVFCLSTTYDQPWEDPTGVRALARRALFWREYRHRGWHYPPFKRKPMYMTTEEIATIYHFPGAVATAPGLQRIGSKKAEAPSNIPI